MNKAISQIKQLINNIVSDFEYVDEKRIGVWIKEGDYLNSKVEISLEHQEIDYELYIYMIKEVEQPLTPHEMFVYLHELSHVIILEKMRTKEGIHKVEKYLKEYSEDIQLLNKMALKEKWISNKIQEEYEKVEFEKETDFIAKLLFARYVRIASF